MGEDCFFDRENLFVEKKGEFDGEGRVLGEGEGKQNCWEKIEGQKSKGAMECVLGWGTVKKGGGRGKATLTAGESGSG